MEGIGMMGVASLINAPTRAARGRGPSFMSCNRGSTALIFGLSFLPLMLMLGVAVDYSRATMMKSRLQASVDAAALAAVSAQYKGGDPVNVAANYVAQGFAGSGLSIATTTTPNLAQGTVAVSAVVTVPTSVMKIAHINSLQVTAQATAALGASGGGFTEVAIAFDTTGSMSGTKLTTAKQAASQLVDTIMYLPSTSTVNPNVKVGLMPFTDYVNIGTSYRGAYWLANSDDFTTTDPYGCVDTYPNATYTNPVFVPATCDDDGNPYDCSYTSYTVDQGVPVNICSTPTHTYTWNGCVGSQISPNDQSDHVSAANQAPAMLNTSCPSPLIRLSNDPNAIKTAISSMTANGATYIAPSLIWGWRVLSPNPPFSDGGAYDVAKKILIVMTDGANTRSALYPEHAGSDTAAANAKLANVCTNVKAAGIDVYTILFQVSDATIQNLLTQCATTPSSYYNATTNADLQAAFVSIGMKINRLRLVD
jgi:Flp pilus assembly protein TadG